MKTKVIEELVNIDNYPEARPFPNARKLTLGDLHGNALKFLFFLIKEGVVACDKKNYQRFVEIYKQEVNDLNKEDLADFETICDELSVISNIEICLIGDTLCDRGSNDYFTLKLLQVLKANSIKIEIMLSNHDFTFIESLETTGVFRSENNCGDRKFGRSMNQLQDLIDAGKLTKETILALVQEAYLPSLKLLSYTVNNNKEFTIFSHALTDDLVTKNLADELGVNYQTATVKDYAATIDAINQAFQRNYVTQGLVIDLPNYNDGCDQSDPVFFLMWNRKYDFFQNESHSYRVNRVHGHDSKGSVQPNVCCLNNKLGAHLELHSEKYNVLVNTDELQLEKQLSSFGAKHYEKKQKENNYVNNYFSSQNPSKHPFGHSSFFNSRDNQSKVIESSPCRQIMINI
ncbi:MAG: hypothetical protein H0U70_11115 [Tatlockia sp.]|nr:hypothetical protein [Tatlockia sp.]